MTYTHEVIWGTVSRELRWVLLHIHWKLFSRAFAVHYKIVILLKGRFTINKSWSSIRTALQFQIVWTMLDTAVFLFPGNSRCHQNIRREKQALYDNLPHLDHVIHITGKQYTLSPYSYIMRPPLWHNSMKILNILQNIRGRILNYPATAVS